MYTVSHNLKLQIYTMNNTLQLQMYTAKHKMTYKETKNKWGHQLVKVYLIPYSQKRYSI